MRSRDAPRDLAIRECKPIALAWIDAAVAAIDRRGDDDLLRPALAINFSLPLDAPLDDLLVRIRSTFVRSREVIVRSGRYFIGVNERKASRVFAGYGGAVPPAYAIFKKAIYFTPFFAPHDPKTGRGFGPKCRAAMLVHESVHVIDDQSGLPAMHISEWDEPKFSAQTVEESVHNPSSYASFSAQLHERAIEWPRDVRYGAGRPAD